MSYNRDTTLLLDLQYLTGKNDEKVIKELVFMHANGFNPYQFHFAAPYSSWELSSRQFKQVKTFHLTFI